MIFFLANQIIRSVQELSYRMLDYFEQLGTLAEALELVSQGHEIVDAPGAKPLAVHEGAIRFEHVSFAHPDGLQVFEDLNLVHPPRRKGGPGRAVGRRQIDAGEAPAPPVRAARPGAS